jgi:serine/threonine-protein kinase
MNGFELIEIDPPPTPTVSVGTSSVKFGGYELFSRLGRGGMAEVFFGRASAGPRAGWPVALKRLLPHLSGDEGHQRLFAQEGKLSLLLSHPNVVSVYEVGTVRGLSFIAMEHVDGRDVGQIIHRCRARGISLPIDFAVYLAKTLLDALSYAHQVRGEDGQPLKLVHCDVSPSNVFISRVGDIKLGDFGVARTFLNESGNSPIAGKAHYLSPEALEGEIDSRSDLWAAAVTLYELLSLERPCAGENPTAVLKNVRKRKLTPVRKLRPGVPKELEEVLTRAFSKRPTDRFESAAEFAAALVPHYDERIGTPLAIAAVVRGLFGASDLSQ